MIIILKLNPLMYRIEIITDDSSYAVHR